MTLEQRKAVWWWGALALGVILFAIALYLTDFTFLRSHGRQAAAACALAIAASGAWHVVRTWAWEQSFTQGGRVPFARLARVRIAAEAFSYLTLRGIAGEPLKVMLLRDDVDAREASAAVALERIAFMVGTMVIVGAGSIVAIVTQDLSAAWIRVFASFAVVAAVLTLFVVFVLLGEGTYFAALLRRIDRARGSRLESGRVARFAADVERQLLGLVRREPMRLVKLMAATVAAYVCMSAEVWLVLWVIGTPVSFSGAMAIETVSRVVAFVTVFIPANLGGLEMSSIAAAAAVGASGAGAPLAFARRIRGLFWAGFGLAVYPTPAARVDADAPTLLYVPVDPAVKITPFARVAGLAIAERAMRSAFRAGYARVIAVADAATGPELRRIAAKVAGDVRIVSASEWREAVRAIPVGSKLSALGAGQVVSHALLEAAASQELGEGRVVDVPAGPDWPVSGVLRVAPEVAADLPTLSHHLHTRLTSGAPLPSGEDVSHRRGRLALRARDAAELAVAERTIRASVIKPGDNKVARWNRNMSFPISIALIPTPLTANQLSIALVFVGFYSGWLYSYGTYWTMVLASVLGLIASILDGCDGEIARLKYQESALGAWIETIGDYSYYIAIFIGMTAGVMRWTGRPEYYWAGVATIAGTLVTFALLIYLRAAATAGDPSQLQSIGQERFNANPSLWTRIIWRVEMVATRSFMPYFILGLAILGLMPVALVLAAIGANIFWTSLVLKWKALIGA